MNRILIANRGEIACRIIRTARAMGIATVAVYSDADAAAPHVRAADQAIHIGAAPARDSYLDIDKILDAARRSGADAIHPGYGFLSENAGFAQACADAGLVFIGPPVAAIRAMGSKAESKALMDQAGVPLVPGYHGADQSPEILRAEAEKIGFPVLIKASAGGGGKGMKPVLDAAEWADQLASARREALAAFGDARMLIEKYLTRPRHVEIQVFGDGHGNYVYLWERDCSIQRRHQKVVEEAPAPDLPESVRQAMGAAAVAAARAVAYQGAGTVEFILEDGKFYFMEMNTRLQVEHPVTEAITGLDLVEWQIRVARGEALPLGQEDIARDGHAIEVRLYAEDPARGFLPQTGPLTHLRFPGGPGLRVDSGVVAGGAVSIHYDPMIAKIIAHGPDRAAARQRLAAALAATEIAGVVTNRDFLLRVLTHPAFAAGELDTGFIDRHAETLLPPPAPAPDAALAAAALSHLLRAAAAQRAATAASQDPFSPWGQASAWRMNRDAVIDLTLADPGRDGPVDVRVHYRPGAYLLDLPDGQRVARAGLADEHGLDMTLDGVRGAWVVVAEGRINTVIGGGGTWRIGLVDRLAAESLEEGPAGRLTAPMPGKVIAVLVEPGQTVERGARLMLLEAMKMEHAITAPAAGTVVSIAFAAGDLVGDGAELLVLAAASDAVAA